MEDFPTQKEVDALKDRGEKLSVLSDALSTVFIEVDPPNTMFPNVPEARKEMEELCALLGYKVPSNLKEQWDLQRRIGSELEGIALRLKSGEGQVH